MKQRNKNSRVPWIKKEDTFSVSLETIANFDGRLTKRKIISAGSFHANWTKGVKLIAQKTAKKIYVIQLVEYFNHANL